MQLVQCGIRIAGAGADRGKVQSADRVSHIAVVDQPGDTCCRQRRAVARDGVMRVKRHVGMSGLQHSQKRHQHIGRAFHHHSNPLAGLRNLAADFSGKAVALPGKRGIAARPACVLNSDGIGGCGGLRRDHLFQARVLWRDVASIVIHGGQFGGLRRTYQRHRLQRGLHIAGCGCEYGLIMLAPAGHGIRVQHVCRVGQIDTKALTAFGDVKDQIKVGIGARVRRKCRRDPVKAEISGLLVKVELHLGQGLTRYIAAICQPMHDGAIGRVAVVETVQHAGGYGLQVVGQCCVRVRRDLQPHRQKVYAMTHQTVIRQKRLPGSWHRQRDIVRPAEPGQQRRQRSGQRAEQRHPLAPGGTLERFGKIRVNQMHMRRPGETALTIAAGI